MLFTTKVMKDKPKFVEKVQNSNDDAAPDFFDLIKKYSNEL